MIVFSNLGLIIFGEVLFIDFILILPPYLPLGTSIPEAWLEYGKGIQKRLPRLNKCSWFL
jgi:hypothetical protein